MSEHMPFSNFTRRFLDLYNGKDYRQALDLLDREGDRFPAEAATIAGWHISTLIKLDDTGEALRQLEAALVAGHWFLEDALTGDPDFAPLLGNAQFGALVERSKAARLRATADIRPALTVIEPPEFPRPWPLVIALHGNWSNVPREVDHWRAAAGLGWLVALPQSSQTGWADGNYVWDDVEKATAELQQHYRALCDRGLIDTHRVVIGGFSMGGQVAVRAALAGAIPVRGFIGVEAWVPDFDVLAPLLEAKANPSVRGYAIAGEQNTEYIETARRIADALKAAGLACAVEPADNAGHGYPSDFTATLRRALEYLCQE